MKFQGVAAKAARESRDPCAVRKAQKTDIEPRRQSCQSLAASKKKLVDAKALRQLNQVLIAAQVESIASFEMSWC